jgi:hypothetical protein
MTERNKQYDPHQRIEVLEQKLLSGEELTEAQRNEFEGLVRNWTVYSGNSSRNEGQENQGDSQPRRS